MVVYSHFNRKQRAKIDITQPFEKSHRQSENSDWLWLFSFLQQKYIAPQQVRKMGKLFSNSRLFLFLIKW